MKPLTQIVLLCLLAGMARAGTFELADPAAEMVEDQQAMVDKLAEFELENAFCTIDADSGKCFCINKETGQAISMTPDECAEHAEDSSDSKQP